MTIDIPHEKSFDCQPGNYSAVLVEIKEVIKPSGKLLRLLFEPAHLSTERKNILVGKNYQPSLTKGSFLRNDLESWLGEDFMETYSKDGKFNLGDLIGTRADVCVVHIKSEKYKKPFVSIERIYPSGTLTKTPNLSDIEGGI